MILHIDFETRSTVDLTKAGVFNYADAPFTDVWCMAYAFRDEDVELWLPGQPVAEAVAQHVETGGLVYAHNAQFEWDTWNEVLAPRYDYPPLTIDQCRCTMAMAYAMGLPGQLDKLASALHLSEGKDMDGHRLMLQLGRPRRMEGEVPVWWDDEDRKQRLYSYCKQDVRVEREVHRLLRELPPTEQKLWTIDQEINARGVPLDLDAVGKALDTIASEKNRIDATLAQVTLGEVKAVTQVAKLNDWIRAQGVDAPALDKVAVRKLLLCDLLPPRVRAALQLRQEAAKSSTAKLVKMQAVAGADGRARGMFQYHGAGTGRWAGRHIQLQNLPRPKLPQAQVEEAIGLLGDPDALDLQYGNPFDVVAWCLRAMISAPDGREFTAGDYAAIEARVLPWLAMFEPALAEFRDFDAGVGEEPYCLMASDIFRYKVKKDRRPHERSVGKVTILQLGFEGGIGAWVTAAAGYGIDLDALAGAVLPSASREELANARHAAEFYFEKNPDMVAELSVSSAMACDVIKQRFRSKNYGLPIFWRGLESAAIAAVQHPGMAFRAGRITYIKEGDSLWAVLPSKRALCYMEPEVTSGPRGQKLTYMAMDSVTRKWKRTSTYGGKLAENVTQAVARDILRDAILRIHKEGLDIVLHVHDELVVEAPEGAVDLERFLQLMAVVPSWAEGLPIAVEGWQGRRYRK